MTKYDVLVKTLDTLCSEAPETYRSYHPENDDADGVNAARSKAFIHLFLKVRFGTLTFSEREDQITEGTHDGGIDAYYIDTQSRTIFFIQSKFRQNERNFEAKSIEIEELLRMDIDRILEGETSSLDGVEYNSKIKRLIKRIQEVDNISRYTYQVIILANVKEIARQKLNMLTGGFACEIYNYDRCYRELLFPLVTASYFTFEDLHIALNLSNKNAAAKISYTVVTEVAKLEITVVFVPTVEIARAMDKYRNAILQHNPRSYLEQEGQGVNRAIRQSIENRTTNEFALFNNGITILSDGTFLNERIGQKDRAQLTIENPQIINGGQTAYTLSQIYRDHEEPERNTIFGEKEVLVKIITFDSSETLSESKKLDLIDAISMATNSQTVVSKADRRSNEIELKKLQARCFDFGIWLERKRGEFMDGVREGYIDPEIIVDRNLFMRAVAIASGNISKASVKKIFVNSDFKSSLEIDDSTFSKCALVLRILQHILGNDKSSRSRFRLELASKAYISWVLLTEMMKSPNVLLDSALIAAADSVNMYWKSFRRFIVRKHSHEKYIIPNKKRGKWFSLAAYINGRDVVDDVQVFFADPMRFVAEEENQPVEERLISDPY